MKINCKAGMAGTLSILLAGCATSNLPELPSVITQPQTANSGPLSELPRLPEAPRATDLSQIADLPQINDLPRTNELPKVSALPAIAALPPLADGSPVADKPTLTVEPLATDTPEVTILAETSEVISGSSGNAAQPPAVSTGQNRATEIAQQTVTAPQAPLDNTRINIEFTYKELEADNSNAIPFEYIANDLVSVLAYIPSMRPSQTSVRISNPGSRFDNLVKSSMQRTGYSFKRGSSRDKRQHLTTSFLETRADQQRSELTAIIAINGTLIRRVYVLQDSDIKPVTLYNVHGIDPQLVLPSEHISVL